MAAPPLSYALTVLIPCSDSDGDEPEAAQGLAAAQGSEADREVGYLEGHGSVPPPKTVEKSGPRHRRDEISIDGAWCWLSVGFDVL